MTFSCRKVQATVFMSSVCREIPTGPNPACCAEASFQNILLSQQVHKSLDTVPSELIVMHYSLEKNHHSEVFDKSPSCRFSVYAFWSLRVLLFAMSECGLTHLLAMKLPRAENKLAARPRCCQQVGKGGSLDSVTSTSTACITLYTCSDDDRKQ